MRPVNPTPLSAAPTDGPPPDLVSGEALLALLGSTSSSALPTIARLVARMCGASTGAVSLVGDDRQVTVTSAGLGVECVPLSASFCAVAVQSPGEPLLVVDVRLDPRFAGTALAQANPGVRSYVGMPLTAHGGSVVGTICALSDEPMDLAEGQVEMLRGLADVAAELLDARRDAQELQRTVARLERATAEREQQRAQFESVFDAAPTGMILVGPDDRYLRANRAFADMLGTVPEELVGQHVRDLASAEGTADDGDVLQDLLHAGRESVLRRVLYVRLDGSTVPALVTTSLVRPEAGGPWLLLSQVETVEARQAVESQMLEVQSAVDGIVSIDARGRVIAWNRGAERLLGHRSADMLGTPLDRIIPSGLLDAHQGGLLRLGQGGEPRLLGETVEVQAVRSDGTRVHVELSLSTWTRHGNTHYTGILRDVTERRRAQTRADLVAHAAATANEASTFADATRSVLADICRRLGWVGGHAWTAGEPTVTWFISDHDHRGGRACPLAEVAAAGRAPTVEQLPHDGRTRVSVDRSGLAGGDLGPALEPCGIGAGLAVPVRAGGETVGTVALYLPEGAPAPDAELVAACEQVGVLLGRVVERERTVSQLRHQAGHDPLTDLPNRRTLLEEIATLQQELADGVLDGDCAVVLIDLDRFKVVNDSLGHTCGDLLLVEVARRLVGAAGPQGLVARLGGDEFVVVARGLAPRTGSGPDPGTALAERLVAALRGPVDLAGQDVPVHGSAGVCTLGPQHAAAPHYPGAVLRDADAALRKAKSAGRDRVITYDATMRSDTLAKLADESALERAIVTGALVLHYQPVVDLATGRPVGAEALVRWPRPGHGLVPPDRFVPLAEETGLIVELGRWVLLQACADAARWRDVAPLLAAGSVSVNVSARQLAHPRFPSDVAQALRASGLAPGRLVLEITESAVIVDMDGALATMHALRATGVRLALDDFGTGYSSMSYVQRLPVEVLKVDKSFIDPITGPGQGTALAEVVLKLAQATGLRTVAEGVETPRQAAALRALGCDSGQGWTWSRAVALDELGAALTALPVVAEPATLPSR